ncbi:ABC transporter ATP-binding protein [Actinomadura rupiterrae]|uniref:ABC transporter ATP-binding protein n=1 Tax=Actinomadura rupiterrae TaxID=559627 RepID=UPI0020A2B587|nr:ABC transporter ATP-binding protein [Actinomadura rupiterrae]MCP2337639.1 ATP-binding cassette subfamily B protein [Actinomadura rupiterrae]
MRTMAAADRTVARTTRDGGLWTAVLALGALGGAALQLLLPSAIGRAIDGLVSGNASHDRWTFVAAGVVAGIAACEVLTAWATGVTGAESAARLRRVLLDRVLGAGPAITRRHPEGDLATRTGLNAEELGQAPAALVTAAALLIPTVGGLVALAFIDLWLLGALVAGLVVITFVLRGFLRATTVHAAGYQRTQSDIAGRLTDALAGIRTIAAAGTADLEARRILTPLPTLREHGLRLWRANARAGVQAGLAVPLLEVVVLTVGGWRLVSGGLTLGALYAAARYAVLGAGLSGALGQVGQLARSRAAAARVNEVLSEPVTAYGNRTLPDDRPGTLEFRDVTVGTPDGEGLRGVDFVVPGGAATAVVGRSGAGKSLLAALAGRLLDPDEGTVLLDGVPLPELSRAELRAAVGYAFERPVLLGETVTDAVALGLSRGGLAGAHEERVLSAVSAARADTFLERLPSGYDTALEDAPMSGGESQRMGIARALAQGERLLVLDDATSSLDTVTEREIGAALTGAADGRTRLLVAHRITTAAEADHVLWLDGGRVRAQGPHDELWQAHPGYRAVFAEDAPPDQPACLREEDGLDGEASVHERPAEGDG